MVVGRTSAKKARPVKKMPAVRKARNATVAKEKATPAKGRRKSRADAAQQVYVDLDDDDDYDDAGDGGDKGDPIEIDEDSEGDLDGSDKEMPAAAVKTPIKTARVKKKVDTKKPRAATKSKKSAATARKKPAAKKAVSEEEEDGAIDLVESGSEADSEGDEEKEAPAAKKTTKSKKVPAVKKAAVAKKKSFTKKATAAKKKTLTKKAPAKNAKTAKKADGSKKKKTANAAEESDEIVEDEDEDSEEDTEDYEDTESSVEETDNSDNDSDSDFDQAKKPPVKKSAASPMSAKKAVTSAKKRPVKKKSAKKARRETNWQEGFRRPPARQSPAEFFAEHQAIAGFDNPGKSLFTTIRELVENSLDACESLHHLPRPEDVGGAPMTKNWELPRVSVRIEEMNAVMFNKLRGVDGIDAATGSGIVDKGLFNRSYTAATAAADAAAVAQIAVEAAAAAEGQVSSAIPPTVDTEAADAKSLENKSKDGKSKRKSSGAADGGTAKKKGRKSHGSTDGYYRVTCRDNGIGMEHDDVPELLGRVLSGSKYGVRQTRGKFGLGAKMALIWSKKSTGEPIRVRTARSARRETTAERAAASQHGPRPPAGRAVRTIAPYSTDCVLDIDVGANEPRILRHDSIPNDEAWTGTELSVVVSGNWTTYKARTMQYIQQLAIVTPYAELELVYKNLSDSKRDVTARFDRRSEQMPPAAKEVKHHPSSVNLLLIQQLLDRSKSTSFLNFLCKDLSSISPSLARRLIIELGEGFEEGADLSTIKDKMINRLVQVLRSVDLFRAPDGRCLSPLGEYNLNLGIHKVIEPDLVATARDRTGAYEGHPFVVEAGVSLGGRDAKEGISVVRFANRIPLLFEGGADVVTRVAQNKIKWSLYKIDHKRDRVGVFVSIVSTKIPFKGTGKEYIGDDITEIQTSVKRALQACCQQLRGRIMKRNAARDVRQRRGKLVKYVPNVSRSLHSMLFTMRSRSEAEYIANGGAGATWRVVEGVGERIDVTGLQKIRGEMIEGVVSNKISVKSFEDSLLRLVEEQGGASAHDGSGGGGASSSPAITQPVFISPVTKDMMEGSSLPNIICHPLFLFRPLRLFVDKSDKC